MKLLLPTALLILVGTTTAPGEVRMAGVFTDSCVLQRDMPLPVWGRANPGEQIEVQLGSIKREVTAGADGKWRVVFDPQPAGGPFTLKASGSSVAEAKDVLLGEVWIGVGQSNMMMGVGASEGGTDALANLRAYPNLRMAHEHARMAEVPQEDVAPVRWKAPNSSSSATSFYFALKLYDYFKGEVPVGILNFTEIRPAEAWIDHKLLEADPIGKLSKDANSARLYHGVVAPVAPFAVRGVLYYQGEMNGGSKRFQTLMTLLIQSWRNTWKNPKLPFLFVQLPGFEEHRGKADKKMDMNADKLAQLGKGPEHGFVSVRKGQMQTFQTIPDTGMAVTIDVGMPWDIHPPYKRQVGERLFLQARHVAYGENNFVFNGPIMKKVEVHGTEARVSFDNGGSQLKFKDGKCAGFLIGGSEGPLYPAVGRIDGDSVVLQSAEVPRPVIVRYAWAGYSETSLFNVDDLPAAPFEWIDYTKISLTSKAGFEWKNPDFAGTEEWSFKEGAKVVELGNGTSAALLPVKAQVLQTVKGVGGLSFNCEPLNKPLFLRPGSLLGYSVDMALGDDGPGAALAYIRLAGTQSGNYFDQPKVRVDSTAFSTRQIALLIPVDSRQGNLDLLSFGNLPRENQPDLKSYLFRHLSPVTILRPQLRWEGPEAIELADVKVGSVVESKPVTVFNGQAETLPLLLDVAPAGTTQVSTLLYGLADVIPDENKAIRPLQTVKLGNNVGVILTGRHADKFELLGDHVTGDGKGCRFLGADGKPGLAGGASPEKERIAVRFKGADLPGEYQSQLRIVTQAANTGRLSQAADGEPPVHLFYVDIPVSVRVR